MRFDDSLDTVLAADASTPFGAQSAWRQLTDLIGRRRIDSPAAIARLNEIRHSVPVAVRGTTARGLAFADPPAALVELFAHDLPAVAAPVIAVARLSDAEWLAMIPGLPPTARALLRHRRDLPAAVGRALDSFGAADFALPGPDEEASHDTAQPGRTEPANDVEPESVGAFAIADLVARIDAYQRNPDRGPRPSAPAQPIENFRFESDDRGMIRWVDGAPREPLIGIVLGAAGAATDGIVAGAFRHRAPFADARLAVPGGSVAGGDWQISAVPGFDPANGRFTGYRGVARRPRPDERAGPLRAVPAAEALRTLVHELRTPTNAISGFAEMIEAEVLGPAPAAYRERASVIRASTRDLIDAIDDVDTAARIEQGALELRPGTVAVAPLLARAASDLEPLLRLRDAVLDINGGPDDLAIHADASAVARLVARLLSLTVGASSPGERLAVDTGGESDAVTISIDRPLALAGRDETELLSPAAHDADDGALLGAGFALRLARNLAAELGGKLTIGARRLTLRLPAALNREVGQLSSN